ncbi:hypothetical protein CR513_55937, partial [Mucuna pruriens]
MDLQDFIGEQCQERVFHALKDRLTHVPILTLLNFSKYFKLECHTSNVSIGVVLLHEGHPITYFSEKLKDCLKELYINDEDFCEIFALCATLTNRGYFRHEGFLFKEKRLCVSKGSIRELLVNEA